MPREKSPPPPTSRLAKVDTASRPKSESIMQVVVPPSASIAPMKTLAVFTPKEALARSSVLVDQIPAVVEQMKFHKKQARRLAELASLVYDAIDASIPKPPPEDTNAPVSEGLEKLIRVLYRIEERLRDVGSGNLVTRMNELQYVQHDLTELEDECSEVADMFGIDASADIDRSNKAKLEDGLALKELAARLEKDPDALADKIGLRGTKLDEESQKSLQIMLYSIEHTPEKVLPEFKSFAESAARTIYSRTKQEIPRDLPWHVRPREFKQGQRIGEGGFSTVFKGLWISRQIEVAIKVFEEQGENIDKLIKEIVIWKDHEHPSLLKFFAGCLFDKPKFIVSPYCKNGNALDYLSVHPEGDRAQMLLDVSRGMLYLHSAKIVHGDLKARNVLISDEGRALVADFGLAEFERHDVIPSRPGSTPSGTGEKTPRLIGTPHWLAPECFKDGAVDRKFADVWALGMTSFELYENGKVPLAHIAIADLSDKLESGERPPKPTAHVPQDYIWKMMELCWSLNTIDRPSFSEITMVLGVFQDPDLETIQEMNRELTEGGIFRPNLTKWPGILERLVQILSTTLRLGPISSKPVQPDLKPVPELSAPEEQLVVLALAMLKEITSFFMYDNLQMQNIYDSGALPALHYILRRKDDIKNPEIMTIACQIVSNVMQSLDTNTRKTSLSQGDFMDALVELIDSPGQKVSTHAMSTVRSLINSYGWGISTDEQLNQKKRVVNSGLVPKLVNICKESKEADALCESLDFITLLGMTPTSLEEEHIKELCPVIMDLAASDVELKPRQYALYTVARLVEAHEAQANHVRSCGIMPKLLDLIKGGGQELFDSGAFSAGSILQALVQEDDIPAILELSQITDPDPEPLIEGPEPYPPMNDARISTKISACIALANIGNKQKNSEERQALADKYPVFTVLQPLLSSPNETLVDNCRRALALYSSSQDFPFVLKLLSDKSSAARVVATKICVSLVESASEEKKIAATESGILPALKLIIDDPPPPPPKLPGFGFGEETDPENIPLPVSPSLSEDTLAADADVPPGPRPVENLTTRVTDDHPESDVQTLPEAAASHADGPQPDKAVGTINLPSEEESAEDALENAHDSAVTPATTSINVASGTLVLELTEVPPPPPKAMIDDAAQQPATGAPETVDHPPSGTPKSPRSPRAKGVTFDSVDQVIIMDTKSYPDDEEAPDESVVTGSPRPMYETSLHDTTRSDKLAERSKATAEALARQEIKNKEEIYQQAFTVLDHIITDVPKDALDVVGEAYLAAGIHESLIRTMEGPRFDVFSVLGKNQLTAMWILFRMSSSTDDVRLTLIHTNDLLKKIRTTLEEEPGNSEAKQYACNILQGLLSDEGDDDEVMEAVMEADFVPVLDKYMKNDYTLKTYGAQVLSQLIWIFDDETPDETVTTAISTLDEFCLKSPENIDGTFEKRMYIIVDYLQGILPKVRKLGLSLALQFAKRSVDYRRTLANTTGLREAVDECAKSEDEEIASVAKDILDKIKAKRGGGAASRLLRSSRPSAAR